MGDALPDLAAPAVSPLYAGLLGRCPRCGKGSLFKGFLSVREKCTDCGLGFSFAEQADGPAVFIMLIAGFIVTGAALITELRYQPPFWVHAALWLPLGIGLPLLMLRPFKATIIAMQYKFRAEEGRLDADR
jgi:uncharacterized protein (DUF983 family)